MVDIYPFHSSDVPLYLRDQGNSRSSSFQVKGTDVKHMAQTIWSKWIVKRPNKIDNLVVRYFSILHLLLVTHRLYEGYEERNSNIIVCN